MIFDWYKVFSLGDFIASGLVSRKYTVYLQDVGQTDILATKGEVYSILYAGTFLPIQFDDQNPYVASPYAVYLDENDDVWLGIESA